MRLGGTATLSTDENKKMDRTCLRLCTTLSLGELHACDYCSRRTRHVFHATIYDLLSVCASLDLFQRLQIALNRLCGNDVSSLLGGRLEIGDVIYTRHVVVRDGVRIQQILSNVITELMP